MRQTAGALVSLLVGALVALGAAAPAQAVRTWGCTAVLPGAGALPAGVRLVAVSGGERSEPSPPAQAVPSWETEPTETIVTWAQEGQDLTGYTWLALSADGEIPLSATCEISIDPGVAVVPDPVPDPSVAPTAPRRLRIQPLERQEANVITFDAATSGGASTSYSHTTSGADRILFAAVRIATLTVPVTVTYGGVAMSFVTEYGQQGDGAARTLVFVLVNPAAGANTVAISTTGTLQDSAVASYTGAAQIGQPDAFVFARTVTSGTVSTSITTVADGAWVFLAATANYSGGFQPTPDTNFTARTTSSRIVLGDSAAPVSPAGTFTAATSGTGFAATRNHIWVSFSPSAGGSPSGQPIVRRFGGVPHLGTGGGFGLTRGWRF